MKDFTIAIIAAALLLGLGGCVYSGESNIDGYYSYGYPYRHLYGGAYYGSYPWPYRYDFYAYRYRHGNHNHDRRPDRDYHHGQPHRDNRQRAVHKSHEDRQRVDNQLWKWKSQPRRDNGSTGPTYGSGRQGYGRHSGNRGNSTDGRQVRCLNGRC